MITVPTKHFQAVLFAVISLLGIFAMPVAHASAVGEINACFSLLNAQDYARAEQAAKAVLQRGYLERTEKRYANLCLGQTYQNMGRARDALPIFQQVEALSQTTEELAAAHGWLGITYGDINDLPRAELYNQRALKAYRELGDKDNEAMSLNNLAVVAKAKGDLERALALHRESLAMQPEAQQAATLGNMASIHSDRKEYKQAIKLSRKAIEIFERNGDAHSAAATKINLGDALRLDRQYPAAERELLAGLNAIRLVGDRYWEADACRFLALLAKDRKKPAEARKWYEQAEALYREIGNVASADEVAGLLNRK